MWLEASEVPQGYLVFIGLSLLFAGMGFFTSWLLRRRGGYGGGTRTAYEGGEEPIGTPWVAFHARYYAVALIFLLFEVEIAFMFPFALAAFEGGSVWMALAEGFIFVGVLGLGLAYAWKAGLLDWPAAKTTEPAPWQSPVPEDAYSHVLKRRPTHT